MVVGHKVWNEHLFNKCKDKVFSLFSNERHHLFFCRYFDALPTMDEGPFASVALNHNLVFVNTDMDTAKGSGHLAIHPLQATEYGTHLIGLITGAGGLNAKEITAEKIDGTGSPRMTEALAVRTALHRQMFTPFFRGNVFLPECRGAFFQHPAPVGFDFWQDGILTARHA